MSGKTLLGDLLIKNKLVDQETINDALRIQISGNRRLGNILVRMEALTEDQLVEALADQLETEIVDISQECTKQASTKLPRYLCRKFDAIPLKLKNNNILEVGMTDPSDQQVIKDLEQYTGHVIEPRLARQSDIAAGIKKHIPYSIKDFFSPESNIRFTRYGVALALLLVVVLGGMTYRYIYNNTYGTVSKNENATIYKNLDLMLAFDKSGRINFLGRGSFAKGYYSVAFDNPDVLRSFIDSRKEDLSDKQQKWLDWAIAKGTKQAYNPSVASSK